MLDGFTIMMAKLINAKTIKKAIKMFWSMIDLLRFFIVLNVMFLSEY